MSDFVEVKTSELVDAALDWAVLFASYGDGPDWRLIDGVIYIFSLRDVMVGMDGIDQAEYIDPFQPSTRWQDGGPLIDNNVVIISNTAEGKWWSHSGNHLGEGHTALIAACRAIVASKLGDKVMIPAELVK